MSQMWPRMCGYPLLKFDTDRIPTLWWFLPVSSAARDGEHSGVTWKLVNCSPSAASAAATSTRSLTTTRGSVAAPLRRTISNAALTRPTRSGTGNALSRIWIIPTPASTSDSSSLVNEAASRPPSMSTQSLAAASRSRSRAAMPADLGPLGSPDSLVAMIFPRCSRVPFALEKAGGPPTLPPPKSSRLPSAAAPS